MLIKRAFWGDDMRRYQFERLCDNLRPLLALIAAISVAVLSVRSLLPRMGTIVLSCAETKITQVVNSAVRKMVDEADYDFGSIADVSVGDDLVITSISVDSTAVNKIKSQLQLKINEQLCGNDAVEVTVPLGTLFGNALFFQGWPSVTYSIYFCNTLLTDISTSFVSAGINQTLHRSLLTVTANIEVIGLGVNRKSVIKTDYLLCETVIVGRVPDSFTEVIQVGEESLGGLINDYGANN